MSINKIRDLPDFPPASKRILDNIDKLDDDEFFIVAYMVQEILFSRRLESKIEEYLQRKSETTH